MTINLQNVMSKISHISCMVRSILSRGEYCKWPIAHWEQINTFENITLPYCSDVDYNSC